MECLAKAELAMKAQIYKPLEAWRRLFATLLLGLWVACGLLCVDRTLGCDSSEASVASGAGSACCKNHGSDARLPEKEGQSSQAAGTACCDAVTKTPVAFLQASMTVVDSFDAAHFVTPVENTFKFAPSHAASCALPVGRPSEIPPIQLLGVSHLPHGPPAHA